MLRRVTDSFSRLAQWPQLLGMAMALAK